MHKHKICIVMLCTLLISAPHAYANGIGAGPLILAAKGTIQPPLEVTVTSNKRSPKVKKVDSERKTHETECKWLQSKKVEAEEAVKEIETVLKRIKVIEAKIKATETAIALFNKLPKPSPDDRSAKSFEQIDRSWLEQRHASLRGRRVSWRGAIRRLVLIVNRRNRELFVATLKVFSFNKACPNEEVLKEKDLSAPKLLKAEKLLKE